MRMITNLVLGLLFQQTTMASMDTVFQKSKITDVTVFFSGAQIKRSADITLSKGKTVLVFKQLPYNINENSVQIKAINNCKILSVKHQTQEAGDAKKNIDELALQNKIDALGLKVKALRNKLDVFEIEEKLLQDNSLLSKKNAGTSIVQIKEAADYYRLRFNEIRQSKLDIVTESNKIVEENKTLYAQLNELNAKKNMSYSQVFVSIECQTAINAQFQMTYYLSTAAWQPVYDFRVDDVNQPLSIVYNANVFQSTGELWENVNLKLSTNNPALTSEKPKLETWYLGQNYSNYRMSANANSALFGGLRTTIRDQSTKEPIVFGSVIVYDVYNKQVGSAQTDLNGLVTIKPLQAGRYALKALYLGYNSKLITNIIINADKTTYVLVDLSPGTELALTEIVSYQEPLIDKDLRSNGTITREEYQNLAIKEINSAASTTAGVYQSDWGSTDLNIRGNRSSSNAVFVDGERVDDNYLEPIDINADFKILNPNLEYAIEIPYTILSDGKDNLVKMKEESVPVQYVYYAAPKLDPDVFIQANILDWYKLNLLSGKSSVYLQGTFTGASKIDAEQPSDTLPISIGRDKNILVQRERNRFVKDKKVFGNNVKETFAYNITLKNNNPYKVKMILEDQYPVSERNSIDVELLELASAKDNKKIGKLIWEFVLEPNEKKVISYKYAIKYPKYSNLSIE